MATNAEVMSSIADGSIFKTRAKPLAERIAERDAKLAADKAAFDEWDKDHPEALSAKRQKVIDASNDYEHRRYHGD